MQTSEVVTHRLRPSMMSGDERLRIVESNLNLVKWELENERTNRVRESYELKSDLNKMKSYVDREVHSLIESVKVEEKQKPVAKESAVVATESAVERDLFKVKSLCNDVATQCSSSMRSCVEQLSDLKRGVNEHIPQLRKDVNDKISSLEIRLHQFSQQLKAQNSVLESFRQRFEETTNSFREFDRKLYSDTFDWCLRDLASTQTVGDDTEVSLCDVAESREVVEACKKELATCIHTMNKCNEGLKDCKEAATNMRRLFQEAENAYSACQYDVGSCKGCVSNLRNDVSDLKRQLESHKGELTCRITEVVNAVAVSRGDFVKLKGDVAVALEKFVTSKISCGNCLDHPGLTQITSS